MKDNFLLMAGPCAIEGEEMAMRIAEKIVTITQKLEIPYIFKGSFKKANRSRIDSFTGIGDEKALKILQKVFPNLWRAYCNRYSRGKRRGYGGRVCRCPTDSCFLSQTNRPCVGSGQDWQNSQSQKGTVYES